MYESLHTHVRVTLRTSVRLIDFTLISKLLLMSCFTFNYELLTRTNAGGRGFNFYTEERGGRGDLGLMSGASDRTDP